MLYIPFRGLKHHGYIHTSLCDEEVMAKIYYHAFGFGRYPDTERVRSLNNTIRR